VRSFSRISSWHVYKMLSVSWPWRNSLLFLASTMVWHDDAGCSRKVGSVVSVVKFSDVNLRFLSLSQFGWFVACCLL
jgi:hypothetical protein